MKPKNAYLHCHRDGLPIKVIADVFGGVRVDFERGISEPDMKALVAHYAHDNLLEVKGIAHDVDTAIFAKKMWPKMDIQFLIERNLKEMDWSPRRDYLARLEYMSNYGVRVAGPSVSNVREFPPDDVSGWNLFDSIVVHGYGYQPEELPQLVAAMRKHSNKRLWVAEYTSDPAIEDDEKRANYHARAIKACPVPIVIYRAQHQADGPGYFELIKGEWVPRPAWEFLKRALGLSSVPVTSI